MSSTSDGKHIPVGSVASTATFLTARGLFVLTFEVPAAFVRLGAILFAVGIPLAVWVLLTIGLLFVQAEYSDVLYDIATNNIASDVALVAIEAGIAAYNAILKLLGFFIDVWNFLVNIIYEIGNVLKAAIEQLFTKIYGTPNLTCVIGDTIYIISTTFDHILIALNSIWYSTQRELELLDAQNFTDSSSPPSFFNSFGATSHLHATLVQNGRCPFPNLFEVDRNTNVNGAQDFETTYNSFTGQGASKSNPTPVCSAAGGVSANVSQDGLLPNDLGQCPSNSFIIEDVLPAILALIEILKRVGQYLVPVLIVLVKDLIQAFSDALPAIMQSVGTVFAEFKDSGILNMIWKVIKVIIMAFADAWELLCPYIAYAGYGLCTIFLFLAQILKGVIGTVICVFGGQTQSSVTMSVPAYRMSPYVFNTSTQFGKMAPGSSASGAQFKLDLFDSSDLSKAEANGFDFFSMITKVRTPNRIDFDNVSNYATNGSSIDGLTSGEWQAAQQYMRAAHYMQQAYASVPLAGVNQQQSVRRDFKRGSALHITGSDAEGSLYGASQIGNTQYGSIFSPVYVKPAPGPCNLVYSGGKTQVAQCEYYLSDNSSYHSKTYWAGVYAASAASCTTSSVSNTLQFFEGVLDGFTFPPEQELELRRCICENTPASDIACSPLGPEYCKIPNRTCGTGALGAAGCCWIESESTIDKVLNLLSNLITCADCESEKPSNNIDQVKKNQKKNAAGGCASATLFGGDDDDSLGQKITCGDTTQPYDVLEDDADLSQLTNLGQTNYDVVFNVTGDTQPNQMPKTSLPKFAEDVRNQKAPDGSLPDVTQCNPDIPTSTGGINNLAGEPHAVPSRCKNILNLCRCLKAANATDVNGIARETFIIAQCTVNSMHGLVIDGMNGVTDIKNFLQASVRALFVLAQQAFELLAQLIEIGFKTFEEFADQTGTIFVTIYNAQQLSKGLGDSLTDLEKSQLYQYYLKNTSLGRFSLLSKAKLNPNVSCASFLAGNGSQTGSTARSCPQTACFAQGAPSLCCSPSIDLGLNNGEVIESDEEVDDATYGAMSEQRRTCLGINATYRKVKYTRVPNEGHRPKTRFTRPMIAQAINLYHKIDFARFANHTKLQEFYETYMRALNFAGATFGGRTKEGDDMIPGLHNRNYSGSPYVYEFPFSNSSSDDIAPFRSFLFRSARSMADSYSRVKRERHYRMYRREIEEVAATNSTDECDGFDTSTCTSSEPKCCRCIFINGTDCRASTSSPYCCCSSNSTTYECCRGLPGCIYPFTDDLLIPQISSVDWLKNINSETCEPFHTGFGEALQFVRLFTSPFIFPFIEHSPSNPIFPVKDFWQSVLGWLTFPNNVIPPYFIPCFVFNLGRMFLLGLIIFVAFMLIFSFIPVIQSLVDIAQGARTQIQIARLRSSVSSLQSTGSRFSYIVRRNSYSDFYNNNNSSKRKLE